MSMPLSGIRILDVSQALAGPISARILGDPGGGYNQGRAARRRGVGPTHGHLLYGRGRASTI